MKKLCLAAALLSITSLAWSGFSEINSVGDITEAYNMGEPKSTVTDSPVVAILSDSSEYFVPNTEKAE